MSNELPKDDNVRVDLENTEGHDGVEVDLNQDALPTSGDQVELAAVKSKYGETATMGSGEDGVKVDLEQESYLPASIEATLDMMDRYVEKLTPAASGDFKTRVTNNIRANLANATAFFESNIKGKTKKQIEKVVEDYVLKTMNKVMGEIGSTHTNNITLTPELRDEVWQELKDGNTVRLADKADEKGLAEARERVMNINKPEEDK
ncbi:hypothetical protein HN958_00425 [Candidatus Falkowbacteria bacterium]|jgi:hypothetical protein|nr:hypothetical protein [Candidatus Falkowbacteria bacterium]MBT7006954.1 hypothetical protein [Candidatus Falkowbacteria bacterium]